MQIQISFQGLAHSNAVQGAIVERAGKLERFYEHLVSCRVVVALGARHKQHGNEYEVHIDLKVPGGEIAVTHAHNADVHVALRDAFNAATRRLEDYARRQRGDVKQHSQPKV
jgi:ribosomal subunit interface protein